MLLGLLLCAFQSSSAAPVTASYYNARVTDGYSSFYDSWSPQGGCGYAAQFPTGMGGLVKYHVGISASSFANGEVCGMCLKIMNVTPATVTTSPFPPVPFVVMVTDLGPTPGYSHWLDFSQTPAVGGNWDMVWQAVDCPLSSPNLPVQYQINAGSHSYYMQLVPQRALRTIVHMCVQTDAANKVSGWKAMSRVGSDNGLWFYNGQLPAQRRRVKVISVDGQILEHELVLDLTTTLASFVVVDGQSQFAPLTGSALPLTAPIITDCTLNATSTSAPASSVPSTSSTMTVSVWLVLLTAFLRC
jgi:hypothetical protein